MTTRHLLHDAGHCFRVVAPSLLALSALALAGTTQGETLAPAGVGEVVFVAWRAAVLGTLLWFLVAVVFAATRQWRDRRGHQRLQRLRERAAQPNRALVFIQSIVCGTAAGQHVVVINLATGATHRAWLPETTVPIGAFVALERANDGVRVIDSMNAQQVESAHRYERRHRAQHILSGELDEDLREHDDREAVLQLIEETERFLKEQGYRW